MATLQEISRLEVETATNQRHDGLDAVSPGDLLTLFVGSAVIRNWQLVNAQLGIAQHLCRYFRLDAEVVFAQTERVHDFPPEHFVARFHIAQSRIEQKIGEQREKAVSHEMPEKVHALRPPARETRSVNHIGSAGDDRLHQQARDWLTFPKADPSLPHYFAATGHAIAPQFWGFWSSHGLELDGRPGASFEESLA